MTGVPRELRTARLLLRGWQAEDAEPLAAIYTQPEYLAHMPPADAAKARAHVARFAREWDQVGYSQWAVEDPASGLLIGRIGLLRHDDWTPAPGAVEVGWVLHRDFHGRGLATEGGVASVAAWRDHLEHDQLISITQPENVRSRAVMERLAMTERGRSTWHGFDVVWYALDR